MNEAEILAVLEAKGAVLRGHFRLSSGRHSDTFVQKFRVLEDPRLTQRFGEAIAAAFGGEFDVVASPAIGAIVLGFATALATGARAIFAERADDVLTFRRGFGLEAGERVLVVEDVVTTGGSAAEVVELATDAGGRVVGVGALIDRGDPSRPPDLGAPLTALLSLQVSSWDAQACPLCRAGEVVADPGSRRR
ncbi:MAG: orotate phosphoribosyltransferase [Actinomycetota bacterium]